MDDGGLVDSAPTIPQELTSPPARLRILTGGVYLSEAHGLMDATTEVEADPLLEP